MAHGHATLACDFQSPCQFNAAIVAEGSPFLLVDLDLVHEQGPPNQWFPEGDGRRPNEWSDLRYYDLVEPASRENRTTQLLLAGRAGHGAFLPSDENWNMQLLDLSHCITSGGCLQSTIGRPITTMIINDRGFTSNGFMRRFNRTYYAFGGEFVDDGEDEWQDNDPRDGVHIVTSASLDAIRSGSWMRPTHGYTGSAGDRTHHFAFDGWHAGHIDAMHPDGGMMMFDGKLSVVHHRTSPTGEYRWFVYARANLKQHGGRYVVVAKSATSLPYTDSNGMAYEPFELITIEGYDKDGPGNV